MHLRTTLCLYVLAITSAVTLAQNEPPPAPVPQAPASQAAPSGPPAAPAPLAFPPVDPASFTATSPTKQTVEDFLHAFWGYDNNRQWQIQAILPTPAAGGR